MDAKNIKHVRLSFPLGGFLGVSFIVLKLCGVINWSWWWVLAPFWGPIALVLVILSAIVLLPLAFFAVVAVCKTIHKLLS